MSRKVGVVGNQEGWNYLDVKKALDYHGVTKDDLIISGGACGVDNYAEIYARSKGCSILIHYPDLNVPSPERYFKRNKQIAKECDILFAFDKKSGPAGTKNTVAEAKNANKPVILYEDESDQAGIIYNYGDMK